MRLLRGGVPESVETKKPRKKQGDRAGENERKERRSDDFKLVD